MVEMTFMTLLYMFFRLAPFILVCFFTLGSVFMGEIRGFVYLVGLCFGMVMTYLIVMMLPFKKDGLEQSMICRGFSLNGMVGNKLPMGLAILSYTFFYLLYPIALYKLELPNLAILILFPLLILGEILWNLSYTCFTPMTCIGTVIVAGCLGVLYSFIIDSIKVPRLQYIHMGSNREVCTRPTKQTFRCKYKRKE